MLFLRLDRTERASLLQIAQSLKRLGKSDGAAEMYRKLGDSEAVLLLHVEAMDWAQAFTLLQNLPQYKALVYVPYAHWLAESDRFVEAQKAFHAAGHPEEAFKVLRQLTDNAVSEHRFEDAGYYYWILSRQCLDLMKDKEYEGKQEELFKDFVENERLAGIYYAYHALYRYLEEPFTSFMPEALFNIARFLLAETHQNKPKGTTLHHQLVTY